MVHGRVILCSPQLVDVDGCRFEGKHLILATASRPDVPPIEGLGEAGFLTNENLFDLDRRPARLAVLGGGPVGCELAQAFARLGSSLTVIEELDRLLAREEPEASATIEGAFGGEGIEMRPGCR